MYFCQRAGSPENDLRCMKGPTVDAVATDEGLPVIRQEGKMPGGGHN